MTANDDLYEARGKEQKDSDRVEKTKEKSATRLRAIIGELSAKQMGEIGPRTVTLLEEAADCATPWLIHIDINSIDCLIAEVVRTLQTHYNAPNLQATATVRLLKAGLRLTQAIAAQSEQLVEKLLAQGAMKRLIYLMALPPKKFASTLRIHVLHAIDQIISWPSGLKSFLRFNSTSDGIPQSGYETLVALILMKPTVRVVYAAGQILAKINFTMTAQKLKQTTIQLLEKSPFYDCKLNEWDRKGNLESNTKIKRYKKKCRVTIIIVEHWNLFKAGYLLV